MVLRFVTCAVGRMEGPLTEMGKPVENASSSVPSKIEFRISIDI